MRMSNPKVGPSGFLQAHLVLESPRSSGSSCIGQDSLADKLTIHVHYGHSCGRDFKAADHLKKYPQFSWQKGYPKDLPAKGWAEFKAGGRS